jgi:Na+-driven multidrug efflux pump
MIFYLDLGITGAAWSVVIVRCLFVLVAFRGTWLVHKMLAWPSRAELFETARPFMKIGTPAMLTQIATPVGNAYITGAVAGFGDDAVAGWAIVGRIIPLAFAGIFALSGAIGPILSQNYGAGRIDRVQRSLLDSLIFTTAYVGVMWLILAIAEDTIILVFDASGDAASMVAVFCYFVAGMQIFMGFLFVANAAFKNLDHPIYSTLFNWGRATLGVIPFAYLGSQWGRKALLSAWGIGGTIFGILALWTSFALIRQLPGQAERDGIAVQFPAIANSPFSLGRNAGL